MLAHLMEPWSKKHKAVFKADQGGVPHSLSNSFAQPLTQAELVALTLATHNPTIFQAVPTLASCAC